MPLTALIVMEGCACVCVWLCLVCVSMMMGIPSTRLRARYGSVGMRLRAGRLTRFNTGGGGPNQYSSTETAYSTIIVSQDDVCVCVRACVHVYFCEQNPWPLILELS